MPLLQTGGTGTRKDNPIERKGYPVEDQRNAQHVNHLTASVPLGPVHRKHHFIDTYKQRTPQRRCKGDHVDARVGQEATDMLTPRHIGGFIVG